MGLILPEGAADAGAKQVVAQLGFVGREKGPRIKLVVAEVLVGRSVELIGARLGGHLHHAASGPPQLGRVIADRDVELLERFDGRIEGERLDPQQDVLRVGAIDQPHGIVAAAASHGEVRTGPVLDDETGQPRQLRRAAVDERHIDDRAILDDRADSGSFRLQKWSRGLDFDTLGNGAHFQRDLDAGLAAGLQHNSGLLE